MMNSYKHRSPEIVELNEAELDIATGAGSIRDALITAAFRAGLFQKNGCQPGYTPTKTKA